jgi:preprotein translocase subunit SecD
MRGVWNAVALGVLVVLLAGTGFYFGKVNPIQNHMKLGLDLKGGVYIALEGVDSEVGPVTKDSLSAAMQVVENRINKLGVSEPVIQMDEGNNRILVQIAGETDVNKAREMLGTTAVLKFMDEANQIVLDGNDVARAGVQPNQAGSGYVVSLELKGQGVEKFAKATRENVGKSIAIMLDDEVISAPMVNEEINGGSAVITGNFTVEEATQLAELINGGALPIKLELREVRVVTATLGADSLAKSAKAGLYGMIFVVLFIWLLYRGPGVMATIALTIYAFLTMAFLIAINSVFTLPGMAGLLLSIGMAVDANVIIFERIKEELRAGKGLRSGIDAGFSRALAAVMDSNVTTIIAGVILWWLGTTAVKGFALTLSVGVMLSLFTSITVTRWLITALVNTGWFGKGLFGIKEVAK